MYRIYDINNKIWITSNIYMSPEQNNNLYILKRKVLGNKLEKAPNEDYVVHESINLYDKKNKLIFVGDIVKAEVSDNKIVVGLVTYAEEFSSYIILCEETSEWFSLGSEVCKHVEVIGNVFDGIKKGKEKNKDDEKEQSLL